LRRRGRTSRRRGACWAWGGVGCEFVWWIRSGSHDYTCEDANEKITGRKVLISEPHWPFPFKGLAESILLCCASYQCQLFVFIDALSIECNHYQSTTHDHMRQQISRHHPASLHYRRFSSRQLYPSSSIWLNSRQATPFSAQTSPRLAPIPPPRPSASSAASHSGSSSAPQSSAAAHR
jgi:hypothetical protein